MLFWLCEVVYVVLSIREGEWGRFYSWLLVMIFAMEGWFGQSMVMDQVAMFL